SKDGGQTWSQFDSLGNQFVGDDYVNMTFDALGRPVVTADRDVYGVTYNANTQRFDLDSRVGNLQVTDFYDITLDPQNADRAYGVAQDHFAAMKFTGSTLWNYMLNGGGETGKVLADPVNSDLLYVSNPLDHANLVARSTDGGSTWTSIFST